MKFIKQETTTDCGIACLLSILRFYGGDAPREWLKERSGYGEDGVTMYGLKNVGEQLGFEVEGKKGVLDQNISSSCPFIAHLSVGDNSVALYHYVVVIKITLKTIKIMDPAEGIKLFPLASFLERSTGNYLFFTPTNQIKKITCHYSLEKEIIRFLNCHRLPLFFLFLSLFGYLLLEFASLFQLKTIITYGLVPISFTNITVLGVVFLCLLHFKMLFFSVYQLYSLKLETALKFHLKKKFLTHLLALPNQYYQTIEKGKIVSLFKDMELVSQYLISSFVTLFKDGLIVFFLSFYFAKVSFSFLILLIAINLFFCGLIFIEKKYQKKELKYYYQAKDDYHQSLEQIIHAVSFIKNFHLEKRKRNKIYQKEQNWLEHNYRLLLHSQQLTTVFSLLEGAFYLIVISFLAYYWCLQEEVLTLGNFLLLEGFILTLLKSCESLLSLLLRYQLYQVAVTRINEILALKEERLLFHSALEYPLKLEKITFQKATFSYYEKKILTDLKLQINACDKVFLYGESGSGKSTLLQLLNRTYAIDNKMLFINNKDINHYNLDYLRKKITYLSLTEGLIEDNLIKTVCLDAKITIKKKQRFLQVIKICGLDILWHQKGYTYETPMIMIFSELSAGEKSRLFLAQALYRESDIYLFDECLSHLDITAERKILQAICRYYKEKIIIYVSHRMNHQDLFNRVFYLKQGVCYEETTKLQKI